MLALLANLAAILAPVLLISGVGFVWVKRGNTFDQGFATQLIAVLSAPCLVFSTLVQMHVSAAEFSSIGAAAFICLCLSGVVGAAALWALRLPVKVFVASITFPNIGNMGLPVCLFAFGERGVALAMIYFTVVSIFQFTLGPMLASGKFQPSLLFKTPFVYAAVAALIVVLFHLSVPQWVINTTSVLGQIAVPLMLLALGVALAQLRVANLGRALAVSLLRLGIGLACGWAVAQGMGFHGAARGVVIVESAMPAAVFNYLFALIYDNSPEEVAGVIMVSTLLSYLTLPFLVAALI